MRHMKEREIHSENKHDLRNETWKFESHFREYLLRVAKNGESSLEFSDQFPLEIELNQTWHNAMNRLLKETNDGKERLALIGFRNDMRELIIPEVFGIGERSDSKNGYRANIPVSIFNSEAEKAKREFGIVKLVGHIHTHPRDPLTLLVRDQFGTSRDIDGDSGFSVGDLYSLVSKNVKFTPMIGVVDGKDIYFAFKTRQTKCLRGDVSQSDFENYWYKKINIYKKGGSSYFLNQLIAREHKLAFYWGHPNQNLHRIYPVWLEIKKSS